VKRLKYPNLKSKITKNTLKIKQIITITIIIIIIIIKAKKKKKERETLPRPRVLLFF
jgi:hypothetical protein